MGEGSNMYKFFLFLRLTGKHLNTLTPVKVLTSSHGNKLTGACQRDCTSFRAEIGDFITTSYGIRPVLGVIFRLQEVVL
jgi:hypothetical protein